MKIIISHGNRKREISGAFSVCGSLTDLSILRDELNRALGERDNPTFCYGWVDIIPNRPKLLANTVPEPWE